MTLGNIREFATPLVVLRSIAVFVVFGAMIFAQSLSQEPKMDAATARKEIKAAYEVWGKAREDVDTTIYEKMLSDDFYALIGGQKVSRKTFIQMVSQKQDGMKLVRFTSQILTLTPKGDDWIAVITEKLEADINGPDNKPQRVYALWVTRDGWRKTDGNWKAFFTEGIGNESWKGVKPPFSDWG